MNFAYILVLSAAIFSVGCSMKPELRTEIDNATGVKTISTRNFDLNNTSRQMTPYDRSSFGQSHLNLQIVRIDKSETEKIFEIRVTADSQSPRFKIKKENSLVLIAGEVRSAYSPTAQSANDSEPMAEYFPAFRTESAVFSNIKIEDLQRWASVESPRLGLIGDGKQEEVSISDEIQKAVQALVSPVDVK